MKTKLNITIEESLLKRIKKYAGRNHVSLSNLTQTYYERLLNKEKETESIFEFLKKMKPGNYPENFDFKSEYFNTKGR